MVFIHGLMGSPDQFAHLAEDAYNQGHATLSILLPGHGGSGKDFVRCGLKEWETHLQNELDKHKHNYQKLYLVGHSMGGLLALNASTIEDNGICGVFLIAPSIKLHYIDLKAFYARIKLLLLPKEHETKKAYIGSNSIGKPFLLYFPLWIKPFFQLRRLIRKTKQNLQNVSIPVIIIHSKRDETVSPKSADFLYKALSNTSRKVVVLEQSWHAYYPEQDLQKIRDELLMFVE